MIKSGDIKISKPEVLTSEYILEELFKLKIVPIRWAITGIDDYSLIISVSYECEN